MAQVLITNSAWKVINEEVTFFANQNKEAVIYPVFGVLTYDNCIKAPWELLTVEDIEYFVITHAWTFPREFATHQFASAGYEFESTEQMNTILTQEFDPWQQPITAPRPQLEIGYVHSHQFSSNPKPSGTDLIRVQRFAQHVKERTFGVVPEIIVGQHERPGEKWGAWGFAVTDTQNVTPLGLAHIVDDHDRRAHKVLTPPYWERHYGGLWEWKQLNYSGVEIAISELNLGWRAFRVTYDESKYAFICVPPWADDTSPLLVQCLDGKSRTWGEPFKLLLKKRLFDLRIEEIMHFIHAHERMNKK